MSFFSFYFILFFKFLKNYLELVKEAELLSLVTDYYFKIFF